MKWRCRKSRRLSALSAYGELTEAEQAWLAAHLARCPSCAAFQGTCEGLVRSIPRDPVLAADDAPSPGFAQRLSAALDAEAKDASRGERRRGYSLTHPGKYLVAGGFAALLVLAGIVIGRYFIPDPVPHTTSASAGVVNERELVEQIGRTREYLDRTRTLLLGIVNARQVPSGEAALDLRKEQEVSRTLSSEGRVIRATLRGSDEEMQRQLIDEIDILLVQLATVEEQHSRPAMEIVRREVEQRGILRRINLADLKMAGQEQRLTAKPLD